MSPEYSPTYKDKHRFAFGQSSDTAQAERLAQTCVQEGRLYDAIDFFKSAGNFKQIDQLIEQCVQMGDFFLCKYGMDAKGTVIPAQMADKVGHNAYEKGKISLAKQAFGSSGNRTMLERIEEEERLAREALQANEALQTGDQSPEDDEELTE